MKAVQKGGTQLFWSLELYSVFEVVSSIDLPVYVPVSTARRSFALNGISPHGRRPGGLVTLLQVKITSCADTDRE